VQILELNVLLIGGSQHCLVLLLQLVESLLHIGLLLGCFGPASEHSVK
jgi:hypothetical protein